MSSTCLAQLQHADLRRRMLAARAHAAEAGVAVAGVAVVGAAVAGVAVAGGSAAAAAAGLGDTRGRARPTGPLAAPGDGFGSVLAPGIAGHSGAGPSRERAPAVTARGLAIMA